MAERAQISALAAPLHRHHREDEYSYVLTGTLGALLGDAVVTAEPGTWVFKPEDSPIRWPPGRMEFSEATGLYLDADLAAFSLKD